MAAERCGICHRHLSDPASIAMGIGPECRSKLVKCGWHYRKPQFRVHKSKVELVSVSQMVPPPIGKVPMDMKHIDRQAREWLERKQGDQRWAIPRPKK